ncbi:MAG: diguanylate cyclase [Reinekea sp.]|jgi:diguanylate cyclase
MTQTQTDLTDFHWLLEVLQTVDVGILVMDLEYNITAWNGFMENNSGIDSANALGRCLFDVFEEVSIDWFKHKAETVIQLRNRAFTTWEQRPYVFRFRNHRPITGVTEYMYQNCTFIPVMGLSGKIQNLAVIVYDVTDVATSKMDLKSANERLAQLSRVDGLTQLLNRAYWEERFATEFARQMRNSRNMSLIMFDIDHFKKVNDTYGHPTGDDVIRFVAQYVRDHSRSIDLAGRYGGEEFCILLLDSAEDDSFNYAERLRIAIETASISTVTGNLSITISLGVAQWSPVFKDHAAWIQAADQALYQSKMNGRNQTTVERQTSS